MTDADRRERRADLLEMLKGARVQFWTCPNDNHRLVTWTGDVAACDTCGITSEMTGRLIRAAAAYERERARTRVRQARNDYYEQACDHSDMTGHEAQQERAFGRVEALDEVLGMLAEVERQEQLAADLGTHADLEDPAHGHDVFSRIEASTGRDQ